MKNYVLCTSQPWGVAVFDRLTLPSDPPAVEEERWTLLRTPADVARLSAKTEARYIFFVHWSHVVPARVLAAAECVNVHCTALPYGRGGNPIENLLLRGHTETVLTAHRMTEEVDAGPIYGARGPVALGGPRADILARFVEPTESLLRWIVAAEPAPRPQEGEPVLFRRLSAEAWRTFWAARA